MTWIKNSKNQEGDQKVQKKNLTEPNKKNTWMNLGKSSMVRLLTRKEDLKGPKIN